MAIDNPKENLFDLVVFSRLSLIMIFQLCNIHAGNNWISTGKSYDFGLSGYTPLLGNSYNTIINRLVRIVTFRLVYDYQTFR